MLNLMERSQDAVEQLRRIMDTVAFDLRVACPGIIRSVDPARQTCTVQLAIRERLKRGEGRVENVDIPELLDVPFFVYTGGGYCLTLPVKPGDDCLVVFGDNCMDAWWQSGGVQNQVERRRHDLSDGFAIVGFRSQPAVVSGYSAKTAQLRNKSGDAYIEISGSDINIVAAGKINVQSSSDMNISSNKSLSMHSTDKSTFTGSDIAIGSGGNTVIDQKNFLNHVHDGVEPGDGTTGGVA